MTTYSINGNSTTRNVIDACRHKDGDYAAKRILDKKILELIYTHLNVIKLLVYRNGTLRADFFRNIWRVEAMRKHFDANEINLFRTVLAEGKKKGLFDIDNVEIAADILHYCIKGMEVPYIRGQIGEDLGDAIGWRYVAKIVYGALGRRK